MSYFGSYFGQPAATGAPGSSPDWRHSMQTIVKHRSSADFYAADFAGQMEPGETLSNPDVRITVRTGLPRRWTDYTAEVLDSEVPLVVDESQVRFRLREAGANEQLRSAYTVLATAQTSTDRTLYVVGTLVIDATGGGEPEAA